MILLKPLAYQKLQSYIRNVESEISGLGKVIADEYTGNFVVEDIRLITQKATLATTTMDSNGVAKFMDDLISEGEDTSLWKLWWHSHANMDVFWSGTDVNTINDFNTEQKLDNYFVSIVGNKAGRLKCRIDVFYPLRHTVDDIPWEIDDFNEELEKQIQAEVAEKVTHEDYRNWEKKSGQSGLIFRGDTKANISPDKNSSVEDRKQYYWEMYQVGDLLPLSDEAMKAYGEGDDVFYKDIQLDMWVPKMPKDKGFRKRVLKRVRRDKQIAAFSGQQNDDEVVRGLIRNRNYVD